jgi:hypothetical protein
MLSMLSVPVTLVATFVITYFLGFEDPADAEEPAEAADAE